MFFADYGQCFTNYPNPSNRLTSCRDVWKTCACRAQNVKVTMNLLPQKDHQVSRVPSKICFLKLKTHTHVCLGDIASRTQAFDWIFDLHNEVNDRLGKPQVARSTYLKQRSAAKVGEEIASRAFKSL